MTDNLQNEIPAAKSLLDQLEAQGQSWRAEGPEFSEWRDKIVALIRRVYGAQSPQESDLNRRADFRPRFSSSESPAYHEQLQSNFESQVPQMKGFSRALVQDLETRSQTATTQNAQINRSQLRIFIVHDGPTGARSKLEDFIRALGAEPVTAENEPSKGRQVSEKVDSVVSTCHYAVALATKARGSRQDGRTLARANVANELPRVRKFLGDRWMVVLQHGVELPSNEAGFVYERFSPQSMDQVFSALVRELRGHGILSLWAPNS